MELSIDQQKALAMASAKKKQAESSSSSPSESAYFHNLGKDEEMEKFPNVQQTGGILPIKTTYNPDKTVDSSRIDMSLPGKNLAKGVGDIFQQAEQKSTETTPEAVQAMAIGFPGIKNAGTAMDAGLNALTSPLRHPIDTAGKVIGTASKVTSAAMKPVVQPIARGIIDKTLKPALETKEAKEAAELGKRVGVNFSAGELTGNSTARGAEDALANSARWSSKFTEANNQKNEAIVNKFKKTLDEISPTSTSQAGLGDKLTSSYKSTIASLVDTRRAQAAVDFGKAEEATGGAPVIRPNNFINVVKDYIKEGESPLATPAQKAASKQAQEILASLTEKPATKSTLVDASGNPIVSPVSQGYKKITIRDLQNGLAAYGEGAASPKGGIWKSLDTASDRRFSKAAKHALEDDMDAAAESGVGEGANALKTARDHYKMVSQKIGDIEQTALGKIVGSAERNSKGELVVIPEKVSARFMSMGTTEMKETLKFLDATHPDVANMARRYTLESALKKASEGIGQRGAGGTKNLGMAEFVKALPPDDKLNALLGSSKATAEVKDVAAAMNRLIDYGAKKSGSQTAQRQDWLHALGRWGLSHIYKSVVDDTLAEDLLNPLKRQNLAAESKKLNELVKTP